MLTVSVKVSLTDAFDVSLAVTVTLYSPTSSLTGMPLMTPPLLIVSTPGKPVASKVPWKAHPRRVLRARAEGAQTVAEHLGGVRPPGHEEGRAGHAARSGLRIGIGEDGGPRGEGVEVRHEGLRFTKGAAHGTQVVDGDHEDILFVYNRVVKVVM